ncbi:MAG: hypothetical protein KIT58_04520 [Planctomycetota bacterium]|nr:hypothetical protein [Planctomycetota bacterium]
MSFASEVAFVPVTLEGVIVYSPVVSERLLDRMRSEIKARLAPGDAQVGSLGHHVVQLEGGGISLTLHLVKAGSGGPWVGVVMPLTASAQERDLTDREREVRGLRDKGLSRAEIADALGLALGTVKRHLETASVKIRRAEARGVRLRGTESLEVALRRASVTEDEASAATLAASGLRNEEIADALGIAKSTVNKKLCRVYRKLRVPDRHALRVIAAGGLPIGAHRAAAPLAKAPAVERDPGAEAGRTEQVSASTNTVAGSPAMHQVALPGPLASAGARTRGQRAEALR